MPVRIIAKCTPSLGSVSLGWSRASESVFWPNNHGKGLFYLRDAVGDEVAEVRNAIVESVLYYDVNCNAVSHLFWLDDDVIPFPGCLLELLHRDRDIVSGVYFTKMEGSLSSPLIYPESGGGTARFIPDQFMEVWGHGMGLTLVRTEVYKRMRDELLIREVDGTKRMLQDRYGRPRWYHRTDSQTELWEDEHGLTRMGMTEDTYFLDQARQLGYRPAVSTHKHAFGFHFEPEKRDARGQIIKQERGYPQRQWEQWTQGQAIVWDTPDGPVEWK